MLSKVIREFIKKNVVMYYDENCGSFNIVTRPKFWVNLSDKEGGTHQVSFKKAIKIINEWNKEKELYYFFYPAFMPSEVIEWLRSETSDFAVSILHKDSYTLSV
ncbi:MAG: hypothetical protein K6G00_05020 [Treponema sp.]|nr:hypothetical protein [Treponema sp.]